MERFDYEIFSTECSSYLDFFAIYKGDIPALAHIHKVDIPVLSSVPVSASVIVHQNIFSIVLQCNLTTE